jgi:hypothetical protein
MGLAMAMFDWPQWWQQTWKTLFQPAWAGRPASRKAASAQHHTKTR